MLAAVHGTNMPNSLIAAMSSWSLHHLGNTLFRLPLALESPFQEFVIQRAYGVLRNLEALTVLPPKGFSKLPGSPGMHMELGLSQKQDFQTLQLSDRGAAELDLKVSQKWGAF